ncbi:MAG: Ig-like domain-containing protein [Bacteroidales bacterium]|nr:Ig-like domain-containing protein [Bacteroidales bacterium]
MAIKKGVCKNFDNCSLADKHEIQDVESTEFVCRECGKTLYPLDGGGGGGTKKRMIILIALALAVVGVAVGAVFGIKSGKLTNLFGLGDKQSFSTIIEKDDFNMKVGETDTVKVICQPADAEVNVSYFSDNENVAVVTNAGVLHAVGAGKTTVTAIVQFSKNHSDTLSASVTVKKKEVGNGSSVNVGYGSYSGPMKGGKAHGVGGTIRVSSRYSIDLKDGRGSRLEVYPGETIENTKFDNGQLRAGELHRNDGTRKWFNI